MEEEKKAAVIANAEPAPDDEEFAEAKHYGPCTDCFSWLLLDQLDRHVAENCDYQPRNKKKEKLSALKRSSRKMIICTTESSHMRTKLDGHVENVLVSLSTDRIGEIIKNDQLIIAFCRDRLKSKVFEERHINPTRQRLRELGSLVAYLQDSLEDQSLKLTTLIDKQYFRLIIQAIRVTCLEQNLNQKTLQTCHSLDDCVEILQGGRI